MRGMVCHRPPALPPPLLLLLLLLQSCAAATSAIHFVPTCPLQAILLDIILILPGLIESIVRPPMAGPGLQVYITL